MKPPTIDEAEFVHDLRQPGNLPGGFGPAEFTSTHCSFVFLTPQRAYKVKRSRSYGHLDYSTPALRRHSCEEEVRLNRRTAPDVYCGVVPIYRDVLGYSLTREGEIVDHAVCMVRLPEDRNALWRLKQGLLGRADVTAMAARIAAFHRPAAVGPDVLEAMGQNLEENLDQVRPFVGRFLSAPAFAEIRERQWSWFERQREILAARPTCDGHGDLRLEHIYLLPEGPAIIDCIEFCARFRVGDPALDLAFLAMDLYRHHRADLAEILLGRYAGESDDYAWFPLVDGYVSWRAFLRAKVACFVAADPATPPPTMHRKTWEAEKLFDLSRAMLEAPVRAPCVVAVGGPGGSGKTTVAEELAARSGAPLVSLDAVRRAAAGRSGPRGIPEAETAGAPVTHLDDELLARAASVLRSGRSVVLDGCFDTRERRAQVRQLAQGATARFLFVECRVSEDVLRARLQHQAPHGPRTVSEMVDRARSRFEPAEELPGEEHVVVDASRPPGALDLPSLPGAERSVHRAPDPRAFPAARRSPTTSVPRVTERGTGG